jgi:3D (Asp-Asp-Asp) domain-containing protein
MRSLHLPTLGLLLFVVGCAQNGNRTSGLSKDAPSIGQRKTVRTTAYTHTERSHRRHAARSAAGLRLQSGAINSAAADWSRFPLGTKFRIVENDKTYVIDDYGSALVGTDTIDLYMPSRRLMHHWGVKHVTIELVQLGSYEKSLEVLKARKRHSHVREMIGDLEKKTKPAG